MRLDNFHRLVPVTFQLPGASGDDHEIAFVDLEARNVHVWIVPLQRFVLAGSELETAVLAEFDFPVVSAVPEPPNFTPPKEGS